MRHLRRVLLFGVLISAIAACGAAADEPTSDTVESTGDGEVGTADTEVGTILVDGEGMTLYGFTDDPDGTSTCDDECAEHWPPVPGDLRPGGDLDTDVFTTIERDDGTSQLVAGGRPLYTYADDEEPGDLYGQGSRGVWFVVAPDGTLIRTEIEESESESEASEQATVAASVLGRQVLTDGEGFTLYYFRKDEQGQSNCNEPCSDTWPPVPANEPVDVGELDPERLGAITRDDGTEQLAYDGRALYLFVDDKEPGDVEGQGVSNVWFAVATDGSEIGPEGGVRVGSTDAGDALIDPEGFTLYVFDDDTGGTSNCNDQCAETWQPVPGDTAIDLSVRDDQFATITREDGGEQLTFNGRPLYRYADDANPGDARGEGVGGVWSAVPADDVEVADAGAGEITVGHSDLGPILVDGEGRTLYAFVNDRFVSDTDGQSNCNDTCAEAWPPVPGNVTVDASVTGETRTVTRRDGSSQLAIGEWPLYTSSREDPGDIDGHGSSGAWFAVAPDGTLYD